MVNMFGSLLPVFIATSTANRITRQSMRDAERRSKEEADRRRKDAERRRKERENNEEAE